MRRILAQLAADNLAPTIAEVLTKTILLFFFLSAMGFWVLLLGHSFLGVHPIGRVEIRWTTVGAHEDAPAGAFTSRRGPRTDAPRDAKALRELTGAPTEP